MKPSKRKGKTRREKLLLDLADTMNRGLREATEPSCITQHRATRSELLNFVSTEGFTPLHYVCDGRVASRRAAAVVLALWQERAFGAAAPGLQLVGGGGGDRNGLNDGEAGGGGAYGTSIGGGLPTPEDAVDRVKILKWLLSEPEVDPKVRVPSGGTTLHMAAALPGSQGADLVRSLIHNGGANLDALDSTAVVNSGGGGGGGNHRSCHVGGPARASGEAAEQHGGGQEKASPPPLRFSALHHALQAGAWESADLLLAAGASVGPEGAFPPCLHVACLAAAPAPLVERLLKADGRVSGDTILDEAGGGPYSGVSPLFLAAVAGSADLIELLLSPRGGCTGSPQALDGIDENEAATLVGMGGDHGGPSAAASGAGGLDSIWTASHSLADGRSPLHAAAAGGHTMAAKALLNAELAAATAASGGSSLRSWLNTPDATGSTPLDVAVSEGHWECAERLAAAVPFDIRLAVEKGPSSALIAAERANMAIVDEGLGGASTLCALRESNTLVMTLLKRLYDAAAAAVSNAAVLTEGTEAPATPGAAFSAAESRATGEQATEDAGDTAVASDGAPPQEKDKGLGRQEATPPSGAAAAAASSLLLRPATVPVVHHLHPCFVEGVLYSNAKGIFVPDTPERRKRRRSSRQQQGGGGEGSLRDDQNRAAVIIQSRARQAGARRAVAEKRMAGSKGSPKRRRTSGTGVRRSWSDTTEQERAAVVIQAQARQARARAETARRRDQHRQQQHQHQQRKSSSKHMGEVGVVTVKAAG